MATGHHDITDSGVTRATENFLKQFEETRGKLSRAGLAEAVGSIPQSIAFSAEGSLQTNDDKKKRKNAWERTGFDQLMEMSQEQLGEYLKALQKKIEAAERIKAAIKNGENLHDDRFSDYLMLLDWTADEAMDMGEEGVQAAIDDFQNEFENGLPIYVEKDGDLDNLTPQSQTENKDILSSQNGEDINSAHNDDLEVDVSASFFGQELSTEDDDIDHLFEHIDTTAPRNDGADNLFANLDLGDDPLTSSSITTDIQASATFNQAASGTQIPNNDKDIALQHNNEHINTPVIKTELGI